MILVIIIIIIIVSLARFYSRPRGKKLIYTVFLFLLPSVPSSPLVTYLPYLLTYLPTWVYRENSQSVSPSVHHGSPPFHPRSFATPSDNVRCCCLCPCHCHCHCDSHCPCLGLGRYPDLYLYCRPTGMLQQPRQPHLRGHGHIPVPPVLPADLREAGQGDRRPAGQRVLLRRRAAARVDQGG